MSGLTEEDADAIRIMFAFHISKLTEWEVEFLEVVEEQAWMSNKQREIFDRIWERVTGG